MPRHAYTLADLAALADALDVHVLRDLSGRYVIAASPGRYIGSSKPDAARQLGEMLQGRKTDQWAGQ